jgi:alpha-tubulin suppressor-like RCC1 family protein
MFVWGANDKRQLGMTTDTISPIACEESLSGGNADCLSNGANSSSIIIQDLRVPHQIEPDPFTENDEGTHLPHFISAGYNYSSAVTQEGFIYTWGNGEFGRLGYVDVSRQPVPRPIVELKDQTIVKIALGYYHAAAINEHG